MDIDEIYKKIERMYSKGLSSNNIEERAASQHIGKVINKDFTPGTAYETMLANVERIMAGRYHPRWYHQNVKDDLEKLQEKGKNEQ